MTFVKTKIELSKLKPGDILEVLLAEGEPLDNVPRNAKEQGYNVLSVEHVEGTTHKVTTGNHHQDRPADGQYHSEITP